MIKYVTAFRSVLRIVGKLPLKNIARPVGVFSLSATAVQAVADLDSEVGDAEAVRNVPAIDAPPLPAALRQQGRARWSGWMAGAVVVVIWRCALGWWYWPKPLSGEKTLAVQAGLPVKPLPALSLVVLPFSNLNADSEQDFFADGLTEDLTTDLSHLTGSFVIARNTAFTYKGKAVDVRQIGRDLGVRYALEGSVRRTGERIILNAQLTSTESGAQLWADRFEGERSRIGEIQAEFVARLARSLDVQLTQAEGLRVLRERASNPTAADLNMLAGRLLISTHSSKYDRSEKRGSSKALK